MILSTLLFRGVNLLVNETKNIDTIHAVLKHPEIFDSISCDDTPCAKHFLAPINKDYRYIVGIEDGEIIGLMVYHKYRDGEECHIQVLPEHRIKYAKDFAEQALEFQSTQNLYAEIPDNYQNVLKFAESFGFTVINKEDQGYKKNGESHLINILRYDHGVC